MTDYLFLFSIVFAIHLMPAFTLPTWPVIVVYSIDAGMPLLGLAVTAAVAATLGRYVLARMSRLLAHRFPEKTRSNLEAARLLFERRRRNSLIGLGLFVLTPVPSAQLFEAAGMAGVSLLCLTGAYFLGRLGFYSGYAFAGRAISQASLGETFREAVTSPVGIGVQVLVIAVLVAFIRFDWAKWVSKRP
jgi:membrane protein YqaA with SNARE-associated domain